MFVLALLFPPQHFSLFWLFRWRWKEANILSPLLSTNIENMSNIWVLTCGSFNDCIICTFPYSWDSGTVTKYCWKYASINYQAMHIYKRQWSNPNECAAKDLKRTCAFGVVSFVWLLNMYLHDRTEKTCIVSTSRCPIQSLRKVLWGFVWDNGRYLQCTRFPSCHVVYIEVLNCLFNLNLFFSGATPCDSTKKHREIQKKLGQQQVQLKKVYTTCLSAIYVFQPIWNMKGRGIGENILDKTIREDCRGETGNPQGYQTFSFYFM